MLTKVSWCKFNLWVFFRVKVLFKNKNNNKNLKSCFQKYLFNSHSNSVWVKLGGVQVKLSYVDILLIWSRWAYIKLSLDQVKIGLV